MAREASIRLLLVEPDESDRQRVHQALRGLPTQFRISDASSLLDVAAGLGNGHFDLALVDLDGWPQPFDGFDRVRSLAPHLPIAVLSRNDIAAEAVRRGADGFVAKTEPDLALLHVFVPAVLERAAERAQRHALLRQVQSSESRYRLLLDTVQDALLLCDAGGKILQVNRSTERLLDRPASELVGTSFLRWIKDDAPSSLSELAVSESFHRGLSLRHPSIPIEIRVSSLTLDDQPAYLVIVRDLRREERAAQLLQALTTAGAAMQGALTPLDVFRAAGAQLRSIGLALSVFRYLEDENVLVMLHTEIAQRVLTFTRRVTGLDPLTFRIRVDSSPILQSVLDSDVSLILPSAVQVIREMLPGGAKRLAGPLQKVMGYEEQFGLRLRLSGQVYGIILVGYSEGQLVPEDQPVIESFALQLQAALERSQRFETTQTRLVAKLQELTHLVRVGKQMQLRLPLDNLLDMICRVIRDGLGWDRVIVWLHDEQTLGLRPWAEQGVSRQQEVGLAGLDETAWRQSDYRVGRAYFVPHGDPSTSLRAGSATPAWQPGDLLVIPIEIGGEMLGAIQVDQPASGQRPTPDDLMSLELFANQAAVVVENALLYERARARLQQRTDELTALTALSAVAEHGDLRASFEHALTQVLRVSGMDAAGISLLDAATGELRPYVRRGLSDALWEVSQRSPIRIGDGISGRALAAGRTIVVTDVANDPRVPYRDILLADGIQTIVGVGLVGRNPVGSMNLYARAARRLADETLDWLTVAGRQIALSVENTRLIESTRRRQRMAEAVREVNAAVASNLELDAVLDAILNQVGRVVPYGAARILLVESDELRVIAARGFSDPSQALGQTYPRDERNPAWQAVLSREVRVIADLQLAEPDSRACIRAPLIVHDEVIGVLSLDHREPGVYTQESAHNASLIAQQAAVAIDNARRYQETQIRAGNLSTLLAASREFGSSLDSDQVLGRLAQWMVSAVEATSARVYVWDLQAGSSRLMAQYVGARASAVERQSTVGVEQPLDEMPKLVEAMKTRRAVAYRADDGHALADQPLLIALQGRGVTGALYLPLIVRERLLGCVEVWETGPARVWQPDEIHLCQTLANVAASAIDNARLFEAERQRRAVAETMRELAAVVSSSLELQPILEALLDRAAELIPYDAAAVYITSWSPGEEASPDELRIAASRGLPPGDAADSFRLPPGNPAEEVLRSHEVVIYADLRDPSASLRAGLAGRSHVPDAESVRDWLGAPLRAKGDVIGVLTFDSRTPGRYRREHAEIAQMIANHAAVAIENARLFQETRRRLAELETLQAVSLEMIQSLDLKRVSQAIADGALRLLEATAVHLFSFDAEADALHMVATAGAPGYEDVGRPQPRREGLTMHVAHDGRLVVINDPRNDPTWAAIMQAWVGLRAIASLPLRIRGRVVGVMNVIFHVAHTIDDNEVRIMGLLADQAATALENARLFEGEQKRRVAADVLREMSAVLTSTLDLAELFERLFDQLARVIPYTSASVLLLEGSRHLRIIAGRGYEYPDRVIGATLLPGDASLSARVIRARELLIVEDVQRLDTRSRPVLPGMDASRVHSWMGAPLVARDEIIGTLAVDHTQPGTYRREQAELFGVIANQAAAAIANARLYEQTLERERFASALGRTSLAITSTLELNVVLDQICRESAEAFGVDSGLVWLVEGDEIVGFTGYGPARESFLGMRARLDDPHILGARVLHQRSGESVNHAQRSDRVSPELVRRTGLKSLAAVPMFKADAPIGTLVVGDSTRADRFSAADIDRAQVLANHAAIAIENARLFQAEQRRARQLALVNRVGLDVTSILDLDQLAQTVVEEIRSAFSCYFVNLVTIDGDSMVWRSGAGGDVPGWTPAGIRQPVGVGITGAAAASGEVVWVPDVRRDPRYVTVPEVQRTLSEVALPLKTRDQLIGVLDVQSDRVDAFGDEDLTVFMALASQLSVAVENALLYQALAQHAASLEARVTERTAEIRREQERTITILNSVADAVLVTDTQGAIVLTNPVAETLLREDERGEHAGRLRAWLRALAPDSAAPKIDVGGRTLQATVAYIHEDDRQVGHVIVLRDITRLEEVDRLKTQFVANVSHELRTPLTNIKLYLGLFQKGKPEKREQYLVTLQNEANRLERLITDLLDLSRLERDRQTVIREPVDLGEVLRHIVATLEPQAEARQQTLRLEIVDPLPELSADRNQMIQVFVNLAANAINYTPAGGRVNVQASTAEHAGQRWVTVAVSDTGVGISGDERDRIFDRFYRGQAEDSKVHGTGLGLSIVKEIVDQHAGHITVESQVGQGSTFTIWLPLN